MNEQDMTERQKFELALADFGQMAGISLKLDDDGECALNVDDGDVNVHFRYLTEVDVIVCWASVCFLPDDRYAGMRACRLLKWNDFLRKTNRFTLGSDAESGRLVAAARFPSFVFDDATRIGAMVTVLLDTVHSLRDELDRDYPPELEDIPPSDLTRGDVS